MMLFSPVLALAVLGYGLGEFLRSGYPPPAYSTLLNETPPHMRGTLTSIVHFTSVLIGFGLGPVMVGMLSDFYGGGVMLRDRTSVVWGKGWSVRLVSGGCR